MKKYEKGHPIFFWAYFDMELREGVTSVGRVQDLLDSSPNLLHAYKEGFVSLFCTCKRPEKRAFMVRSPWAWVHGVKRERESFLLSVRKIYFSRVCSLGFEKREKMREKLFSSPSFFHILISSRSPSLTYRKVSEIWRKDPNQPRRRSSRDLALPRRSIRTRLRVDFS